MLARRMAGGAGSFCKAVSENAVTGGRDVLGFIVAHCVGFAPGTSQADCARPRSCQEEPSIRPTVGIFLRTEGGRPGLSVGNDWLREVR
ncbi:hypothetical protein Msi02_13920 [Microbispora siamensis]|uniref:Uncharacterized protein n=1 Tax=Microbispora siamensis TaxID=564413 RepID=A0ABQ4GGM1_9ACTN|nr:hypothetical protein Msi02_13920 [Microbispora siamensis]